MGTFKGEIEVSVKGVPSPRRLRYKEMYEGKTFTNRHGEKFTVKEYVNSQHLILDWGNGEVTKNNLDSVTKGSATYRTQEWKKRTREGMLFSARNGDKFYVKEYRNARDITVVWENGTETVSDWTAIKAGTLSCHTEQWYKDKYEGMQVETPHGTATLIEYYSSKLCLVRWDDGTEKEYHTNNFVKGEIANPSKVRKGYGERKEFFVDNPEVLYRWSRVFARKNHKIEYEDVYIAPCIQVYEDFEEKVLGMKGFKEEGFHMDKDILSIASGYKPYYSLDTISFVPVEINTLCKRGRVRENGLPTGVSYDNYTRKNRFKAEFRRKHLGTFPTPHQAQEVYVKAKKVYARELAEKYEGKIDERVYIILLDIPVEGWDYTFDELKDREKET